MPLEPFESDSNLSEDVGMFTAAVHARPLKLETLALDQIVVAPDGSNQDEMARAFAAALAAVTQAQVYEHSGATSAADILRVCAAQKPHLLVVPAPFGRDSSVLKDESLGSVVDMLLVEASIPILCIREVLDASAISAALSDILVPLTIHDPAAAREASWAIRILGKSGQLELLAIADQDALEEARSLLGPDVDPSVLQSEALSRVMTEDIGSLTAAVQKWAASSGQTVHVELRVGRFVSVVLEEANRRPRLTIVGAPRDHKSPAFHRATDIIRGAHGPVLVV